MCGLFDGTWVRSPSLLLELFYSLNEEEYCACIIPTILLSNGSIFILLTVKIAT